MTELQAQRLAVVRHYYAYVRALGAAHLNHDAEEVRHTRAILATAIEEACTRDPNLLKDFKRAFTAQPSG